MHRAAGEHAVDTPIPESGSASERELEVGLGRAEVSMLPVTRSLTDERGRERPAARRARGRAGRSGAAGSPPPSAGAAASSCRSASTLPSSPVSDASTCKVLQRALAPECAPEVAARDERRKRRGGSRRTTSGSRVTSVARPSVSKRVSRWTLPVAWLTGRSPSWCRAVPSEVDVAERSVEGARRSQPAVQDHRRRHESHGAEVDVRAPQVEVGKGEPAVGRRADDTVARDQGDRVPGTWASAKAQSSVRSIASR